MEQNRKTMELNRETAMRLWNRAYGNAPKATDFAGRTMAKGAYNDRNSGFGWNVDHVLPQSRGGATADHNLVCCHIQTNDEKADRFPCFKANGRAFEIRRVQNHYEIQSRTPERNHPPRETSVDFYDGAAGLRLFRKLEKNDGHYEATVRVQMDIAAKPAVAAFVAELFRDTCILSRGGPDVTILSCRIRTDDRMQELLDRCVLLNTYLSAYFVPCGYLRNYGIFYSVERVTSHGFRNGTHPFPLAPIANSIYLNDLVLEHTEAGTKTSRNPYEPFARYDCVFPRLAEQLKKEANCG